jgi:hypothetical protein
MNHTDKTATLPALGLNPQLALYEIPRGRAAPVLVASGFIKQFDSGDIQTVLVEVVPLSAAYNLVKAL